MRFRAYMSKIRLLLAGTSALAVVSMMILFSPAPAAAGAVSCTGTSVVRAAIPGETIRVPTAGSGTGNWHCDLGVGNDSAAVAWLQQSLNDTQCSFISPHLAVDGDYGPLTRAAVRSEQWIVVVPIDGVYGPVTGHAMIWPRVSGPQPASGLNCGVLP